MLGYTLSVLPQTSVSIHQYTPNADLQVITDHKGDPWFVASDVAHALGLGRAYDVTRGLEPDECGKVRLRTEGGVQSVSVVNEPGLYAVVMRSRRPEARPFDRWVRYEVLPSIRRDGGYSLPGRESPKPELPMTYSEALRQLASEVEAREIEVKRRREAEQIASIARQETEALRPAAVCWEALAACDGNYSLRQAASILSQDPEIETGQNRLMATLRELGMVCPDNQPYACHSHHLVSRPRTFMHPRTQKRTASRPQLRVTPRGLQYLHRVLGGAGKLPDLPEVDDIVSLDSGDDMWRQRGLPMPHQGRAEASAHPQAELFEAMAIEAGLIPHGGIGR